MAENNKSNREFGSNFDKSSKEIAKTFSSSGITVDEMFDEPPSLSYTENNRTGELDNNQVTVKDMSTGEENKVDIA